MLFRKKKIYGHVRARLQADGWKIVSPKCQGIFCQHPGTLVLNRFILVVTVQLGVR